MRRKALGKGLEALIPKREQEALDEGYRMISVDSISPNPYQPRENVEDAELKDLIASVKEKGVIEPLIVRRSGTTFTLAAGERRLKAARLAGLQEVPVIIRDLTDQELLEIGLIENLHRKDLDPMEEADAYEQLSKKFKYTHEQIARLVSKDRTTVTNTLRLLTLPEKIKHLLRSGTLHHGHARALLALEDETKMLHVADRIVRDHLSVRQTEALIKRMQHKPHISPGREKEANLLILEDELSKLLHTKVIVDWKKNKGTITIHCYSLDDFDRIYSVLRKSNKKGNT
jgi:ParB family chromosome partitioning protein